MPLFSPLWYRVADLKVRLRPHIELHRHDYRDQIWYILEDKSSGRHHRFTPAAYAIIGRMDGRQTVQQIWETVLDRWSDDAPTQDQTIQLLGQLHAADALQSDISPDSLELFQRHQKQKKIKFKQRFSSPVSLRFPLWDPDHLLNRILPFLRPLVSWGGGLIWLIFVVTMLLLAAENWVDLTENSSDRILAPQNLLLIGLIYPIMKVCHEMGHAFATKVWGGEVHEMGVLLLVFMPVPYVDASASSAFREKNKRMMVAAAGMVVELFLAALAMLVWLLVEPGLVRAISFNIMLIGGVSTLLFNGNPLLRFDGYYLLADGIEIQNLAGRANQYLGYLAQRYLFGISGARSPVTASGEKSWFISYGIASYFYRLVIVIGIVFFIAEEYKLLGALMAIWAVITLFVIPVKKGLFFLVENPGIRHQRLRALTISFLLPALVGIAICFLPLPYSIVSEGVIWMPEQALIRAGGDGFVSELIAKPNSRVYKNDPLVVSSDPLLLATLRVKEMRVQELKARYSSIRHTDRVQADILQEQIATAVVDLQQTKSQSEDLTLYAPLNGTFIVPRWQDIQGKFVQKGDLLGYVVNQSNITVRAIVQQFNIDRVRRKTEEIEVRFLDYRGKVLPASILREIPAATGHLPTKALGTAGGGSIVVDPNDSKGLTTLENTFQLDIALPKDTTIATLGNRVAVRFKVGKETLLMRASMAVRQLLLRRLDI